MTVGYRDQPYPNRLRVTRKIAGYQQQHIAQLLGLNNVTTLSNWENQKSMPSGINLIKLCILYDTTPKELYPHYYHTMTQSLKQL